MEGAETYIRPMASAFESCLPTAAKAVPDGPDWIHEIKYDGYRLRVERNGKSVLARNGHDWTSRYPWIVQAGLKNRDTQFVRCAWRDGSANTMALHFSRCVRALSNSAVRWPSHDRERRQRWQQVQSRSRREPRRKVEPRAELEES